MIEKRGGWLYHEAFPDDGKVNGDKKFRELLAEDHELYERIVAEVKHTLAGTPETVADIAPMIELDDEEALAQGFLNSEDA